MAINNTLKDIREERNLIQADLAEAIGSCSQTIGRIERGERNPSLEIAIRLAHYLKVPVEDIFKLKTEAQHPENRGVKSPVFLLLKNQCIPFTKSAAFFISSSFGWPLAIPPTSLNGPNVSYPLQPNFPTTLACLLSKICSMVL